MKKFILILIYFQFLYSSVQSQVYQEWASIYSSPGIYDIVNKIVSDDSGNVYIAGSVGNPGNYDYATIKYNTHGVKQWSSTYNGTGEDAVRDMVIDHAANIYITGYSFNTGTDNDYLTIKYNSSGEVQWTAIYNDSTERFNGPTIYNDEAYGIAIDTAGNVFVMGTSGTIKYNSAGTQIWVVKDIIFPNDITTDISGNVYITGFSDINSNGNRDLTTIKYNSSGIRQWVSRYGRSANSDDDANSISIDASGNVYVTGYTENNSNSDYLTIKYNSIGVIQWDAKYGGSNDDNSYSIAVDVLGNVVVNGSINRGHPWTTWDYATIKYNSAGVIQWISTYNGTGNWSDQATGMILDNSGNVYVTGYSVGVGSYEDYATIKYNSLGIQQWCAIYNGSTNHNDEAYSITIDKTGNIYITGITTPNGDGNWDFTTIKYSQLITQISNSSDNLFQTFKLSQNYPNPFNPRTIINYELPITNYVNIKIFDALGKEVATLVNEKQNPGSYSVEFNGEGLPSGIYFYKLEAGDFTETKRMVLLK